VREYLQFFFGTPRRFLVVLGVIAALAIFSVVFPGAINGALNQLISELMPHFALLFVVFLLVVGVKVMTKGNGGKK
jgi:hypothetical protein